MAHSGTIIHMRNVPGFPLLRALDAPLPCKMWPGYQGPEEVPVNFRSDGASVPWIFQRIFPRHNHPIATFRHDFRCDQAENDEQRAWSDAEFRADVGTTSRWITKEVGYIGVRIGAFFGVGSNYR